MRFLALKTKLAGGKLAQDPRCTFVLVPSRTAVIDTIRGEGETPKYAALTVHL